jgi:hypothetical protein
MGIGIGSKQPRYGPRMLSGWERFQAWQNSRKHAVQGYLAANEEASAAFSAALINQVQGQAELATKAAIKRIAEEAAAKVAKAEAMIDKVV